MIHLSDFEGQGEVYRLLLHDLQADRLSHASLLSGPKGVGKRTLAGLAAQFMFCTGQAERPCGHCSECQRVLSGNHPDLHHLRPGKNGKIDVDSVRQFTAKAAFSAYEGRASIFIVENADCMNAQAQNALLKSLEEPLPGVYYFLTADKPSLLLPTIISRCRRYDLHAWEPAYIRQLLIDAGTEQARAAAAAAVSGGSIASAFSHASDEAYWLRRTKILNDFFCQDERSGIIRAANEWKKSKGSKKSKTAGADPDDADAEAEQTSVSAPMEVLDDIEDMVHMLQQVRYGLMDRQVLSDWPAGWQAFAENADSRDLIRLMDAVHEARQMCLSNVTWQAIIEKLLLQIMEVRNQWQM